MMILTLDFCSKQKQRPQKRDSRKLHGAPSGSIQHGHASRIGFEIWYTIIFFTKASTFVFISTFHSIQTTRSFNSHDIVVSYLMHQKLQVLIPRSEPRPITLRPPESRLQYIFENFIDEYNIQNLRFEFGIIFSNNF